MVLALQKLNQYFMMSMHFNFFDEEHSNDEERFLMLGMSSEARVLLVCHCERDKGNTIRIISARKATKNERKHYQGATL